METHHGVLPERPLGRGTPQGTRGLRSARSASRTDDGEDVWSVWKSRIVRRRGDTVHGRPTSAGDPTRPEAELVVDWAEQMMTQLTLRLVRSTHPLHDLFVGALEKAAEAHKEQQE